MNVPTQLPTKSIGQRLLDLAFATTVLEAEGYTIVLATAYGFDPVAQVQIAFDRRLDALVASGSTTLHQGSDGAYIVWMRDGVRISAVAPGVAVSTAPRDQ